jgi:hypothetical protein
MGEVFGLSVEVIVKAALFWAIVSAILIPNAGIAAGFATIMSFLTAWLFGKFGWWFLLIPLFLLIMVTICFGFEIVGNRPPRHNRPIEPRPQMPPGPDMPFMDDILGQGPDNQKGRPIPPNKK